MRWDRRRGYQVVLGATPGYLKFSKPCPITGEMFSGEAPTDGVERWRSGWLIHEALPRLTASQREFLISGLTPATWDSLFNEEV